MLFIGSDSDEELAVAHCELVPLQLFAKSRTAPQCCRHMSRQHLVGSDSHERVFDVRTANTADVVERGRLRLYGGTVLRRSSGVFRRRQNHNAANVTSFFWKLLCRDGLRLWKLLYLDGLRLWKLLYVDGLRLWKLLYLDGLRLWKLLYHDGLWSFCRHSVRAYHIIELPAFHGVADG